MRGPGTGHRVILATVATIAWHALNNTEDRGRAEFDCLLDFALLIRYCSCSELRFRNERVVNCLNGLASSAVQILKTPSWALAPWALHVQVDETARSTRDHLYFTRCHHTGTICLTSRQSDTCFTLIFLSVCLFATV